jgi:tetratricopeptide (TPR) repeat protein
MNVTRSCWRVVWTVGLTAVALAGCASWKGSAPNVADVSERRRQRTEAAARDFDEKRDEAEFQAAQDRWQQGDVDGSTETLQRLLARSPDHLEARLLMAEALLAQNRSREAVAYLDPALAAHPDDARVQHMMGLVRDSLGERADALACYREATRLEPNNEVYAVSYETLACPATASSCPAGKPQECGPPPPPLAPEHATAIGSVERPKNDFPISAGDSPPTFGRCPAARESGQSPGDRSAAPRATEASGAARSQPPARSAPGTERAGCAMATDYAGPMGPADDAHGAKAAELLEKGRSALCGGMEALAFAYFHEALDIEPHDPQIGLSAAACALEHNQPALAVSLLEPLLGVFPDSVAVRRILGAAYYRLGEYARSQVVLQQALSLDKSDALSYFLMGSTLVKLGQSAAAEANFRQAQRLDPRYAPGR